MFANLKHRRLFCVGCVALALVLVGAASAMPQNALPPVGTWTGTTDHDRVVTLTVTADGGFYLEGTTTSPVVAIWTWTPISPTAGLLDCTPADGSSYHRTVYQVVWLAPDRIELSCTHFTITLRRMI